ncbi:DJ-1/PfpI family protein [Candidatus Micrarchaeota archaeon]|nr:DJ-1/PfpI family protein [Candidatus Micrarchaeota archaeon]
MAKILMVVAQQGFRDEELFVPKELLQKAGHTVTVASVTRGKASGSKGGSVAPDMGIYEANPDFFAAIVIVGGPGSPSLADNGDATKLVEHAYQKGKIVSAICLGPLTLARAGVLVDKNATIFPDPKAIKMLRENGAVYWTQKVVRDGNILTADSPESAPDFAHALVDILKEKGK